MADPNPSNPDPKVPAADPAAAPPAADPAPVAAVDPAKPAAAPAADPAPAPDPVAPADPAAPKEVVATWPENWRDLLTKGDEKRAKLLGRYASPEALADALVNANEKIRSGQIKPALPENATPEQIKEYREANGIPEDPKGYLDKLPKDLTIAEQDREIIAEFLLDMHAVNATPEIANAALQWHNKFKAERDAKIVELDRKTQQEIEDALHQEWGPEYRANQNAMMGLLDMLPGGRETAMHLLTARGADGKKLGGSANVVRGLVQWAKMINPSATIVPGAPSNAGQSIQDELAQIERVRRDTPDTYYGDNKMLARERELLAAQERLGAKAA